MFMGRIHAAPSVRTVVVSFAAVAVSFVLATVASEYSDLGIGRSARAIATNAAPSIAHLEALRSEARRLLVLADDYVDQSVDGAMADPKGTPGPPVSRTRLLSSLGQLDVEWNAYRALPTFPHETDRWGAVAEAKEKFSGDVREALAAIDARRPLMALEALDRGAKPDADALDDAVVRLVDLNAERAKYLGAKIDSLGRRSIAIAALLDGVSVALTILTALLLLRILRRYSRLADRRAEELELFAGRVAHDILSPLGAASLAFSHLRRSGVIQEPRMLRFLTRGQAGIEHTRLIADDLLKFASAGALPDPDARADVRAVLSAVVDEARPLADERRVTLSIEQVDAATVVCSAGILASLVSNLVRNAVKYVGEGPDKQVVVRARDLGAVTRVEVDDNGPGLPLAMERAVFDPYVRGPDNREPGIGLGLATVKRMAESHGGRVDVRSVPGVGCRFAFELPTAREPKKLEAPLLEAQ